MKTRLLLYLLQGKEPRRRGVDCHRGVHAVEGDALKESQHVAKVRNGHADLADLAAGELVICVVARLGRQIEGDRKARLTPRQVRPVKRIRGRRRSMPRIGPEEPRLIPANRPRRRRFFCRWLRLCLSHGQMLRVLCPSHKMIVNLSRSYEKKICYYVYILLSEIN